MKQRNWLWLVLVTFILSPTSAFLWLGQPKWAIAFFLFALVLCAFPLLLYLAGWPTFPPASPYDTYIFWNMTGMLCLSVIGLFVMCGVFDRQYRVTWYSHWSVALVATPIAFWLISVLLFRTFAFQSFTMPASSMAPALRNGDNVLAAKYEYGYSHYSLPFSPPLFEGRIFAKRPERGDIVFFRLPSDTSVDYVKRLIGMPGETVQIVDGIVYIDNLPLEQKPLSRNSSARICLAYETCAAFREYLPGGTSHIVLQTDEQSVGDNTVKFRIPKNSYFMLGDNRDNSLDSRFDIGFVPFENIIGKLAKISSNAFATADSARLDGYADLE